MTARSPCAQEPEKAPSDCLSCLGCLFGSVAMLGGLVGPFLDFSEETLAVLFVVSMITVIVGIFIVGFAVLARRRARRASGGHASDDE